VLTTITVSNSWQSLRRHLLLLIKIASLSEQLACAVELLALSHSNSNFAWDSVQVRPSNSGKGSKGTKDDMFGHEHAERQRTEEGWAVYSEAELKLSSKGGGTDLCPFDCNCCF
jgi:Eukaryotic protein of unknown function (DUF1764)